MTTKAEPGPATLEKLASLAKRRGFVFQSSEIYGGLASTWDYGPLGVLMKNNVKAAWWKAMVQERDDIVGIDAAILMHPRVWEASGHVAGFADPLVECKQCHTRFRPDHVSVWEVDNSEGSRLGYVTELNSQGTHAPKKKLSEVLPRRNVVFSVSTPKPLTSYMVDGDNAEGIPCPICDVTGQLTEPRMFNLMFKTHVGPVEEQASIAYLRPETAQGIFVNFENVQTTTRRKLPFGIAQIGKSFRNEITTGTFIFRSREFEQMEMEYFVKPGTDQEWFEHWVQARMDWWVGIGLSSDKLRLRPHDHDELSHYSRGTSDIEYEFPWGWGEIEGIANRGDYDLKQHAEFSGKGLKYFDEEANESLVPYVIEPASGVDRGFLACLSDAYAEEMERDELRVVLRLRPSIAPIKVAVLPLSRKEPLRSLTRDVYDSLRKHWMVQFDEAQSIGRRYRRQDEIGTPLCVTVDFDSLEDKQATIRDRDTMGQVRLPIDELVPALRERLGF